MADNTLLDQLRLRGTFVDCDTLDASVAESLGPFQDCTSNQAIAYFELQEHRHKHLLKQSISFAKELTPKYEGILLEDLAVEIAMVKLGLRMVPYLKGCIHIQTNPFEAYSTSRTIAGAERIISLFKEIDSTFDSTRVCVKIPSTWEGLQACAKLEEKGITTLATTLFTIEQAVLAGEANCTYIAPYLNELKVHFEKDYHDPEPDLDLVVEAQRYYGKYSHRTQVLPASLVSIQECMAMAGVRHITIAPPLLRELSATKIRESLTKYPSLFDQPTPEAPHRMSFMNDEAEFRLRMTRNKNGINEVKLVQAINIFCDMQLSLREMMKTLF